MSHKIKKHHLPKAERKHANLDTHREKKDQERLRLGNLLLHAERFERNREAVIDSHKQDEMTRKVKAKEVSQIPVAKNLKERKIEE